MTHKPLAVISIVGLTPGLLGQHTPNLNALVKDGFSAPMDGVFPAVTCTAQASMLTGLTPSQHGIVANGWYFRELAEVMFWKQANGLMQGEKVWETARKQQPGYTTAKLFWWYNMYASVDWSVTPRPIYPADGRKIPGLYSSPAALEQSLQDELGDFPFFDFWGPKSGIASSDWIARCGAAVFKRHRPNLSLIYLPHLDYNLQRLGPNDPRIWEDVRAIDRVAGTLIDQLRGDGADILVVSEYGIDRVDRPVHINRVLRDAGLLAVRETLGWELLDCGASRAFGVADHQVAHVYVKNPGDLAQTAKLLRATPGIEHVLEAEAQRAWGIAHPRSGELVAIAAPGAWFTYYYWLDDAKAPDFARTVDIHRKPGYDPVELFVDPTIALLPAKIAWRVLQKKLGFRMLMDVIPLTAELVKGSHGRLPNRIEDGPMLISSRKDLAVDKLAMTGVRDLILKHR